MKFRPRLIPAVILAATVLLGLKVSDIFSVGSHALAGAPAPSQASGTPIDLTSQANAVKMQGIAPQAGNPEDKKAPEATKPTPPAQQPAAPQQQAAAPQQKAAPQGEGAKPAEGGKPTQIAEAPATGKADGGKTDGGKTDGGKADAAGGDKPAARVPMKDPLLLSPAEIEVLQQLSARRTQIDQRAADLDQQQVVLQATEKRIDDKIAKLDALQKSIQISVDQQNAADDARTQSLVKIYETMKPADASQILSQLDMPILLQMLSKMKEAKTAPILAAMDPAKAEAITTAMARRQNPPAAPTAATAKP